jgi:hypothetical protein
MFRYVLLKHTKDSGFHVDFLLDFDAKRLLTWQIADEKFFQWLNETGTAISMETTCQRIFDHRKKYLNFEGEIDNHRGFVEQIESGEWEFLSVDDKQFIVKTIGTPKNITNPIKRKWRLMFPKKYCKKISPEISHAFFSELIANHLPPADSENWGLVCEKVGDVLPKRNVGNADR